MWIFPFIFQIWSSTITSCHSPRWWKFRLHLFWCKMFIEKPFSLFSGVWYDWKSWSIENIFGWPGNPFLIFVKLFPFFKVLNHFPNLIFSFSHALSLAIYFPLLLEVARDPWDPPPAIAIRLPQISPAATTGGHWNPLLVFASGCQKLLSEVVYCCWLFVWAKRRKMFPVEIIFSTKKHFM